MIDHETARLSSSARIPHFEIGNIQGCPSQPLVGLVSGFFPLDSGKGDFEFR